MTVRFRLQLVKRELHPAHDQETDAERARQIMFANLRRRVMLENDMPFTEDGGPGELAPEFLSRWLGDMNLQHLAEDISSTPVYRCPCNTCRGHSNPGVIEQYDKDLTHHLHWKSKGHSRSVGIVSLMPLEVFRDWPIPNGMQNQVQVVHAIEMIVDDRLLWCAEQQADDEQLKQGILQDVKDHLQPRLGESIGMILAAAIIDHVGNRSVVSVVVELKDALSGKLLCKAKGGRTLLSRDLR